MARVGTVLTVPTLYRIQISLAIAMAAMMGMLLSEESSPRFPVLGFGQRYWLPQPSSVSV